MKNNNNYQIIANTAELKTNVSKLGGFAYATSPYILNELKDGSKNHSSDFFDVRYIIDNNVEKEFKDLLKNNKLINLLPHVYIPTDYNDIKSSDTVELFIFYNSIISIMGKITYDPKNKCLILNSNENWHKFIKFAIWDLEPPTKHLNDFMYYMLLNHGYLTLHASAIVDDNGDVTILMGKPNTGKSISTYHLVKDKGYSLLGDDIIVIDTNNGMVYSCPYSFTYFHNKYLIKKFFECGIISQKEKIKIEFNESMKSIPLVYLFTSFSYSYEKLFKKLPYTPIGNLKNMAILEKCKEDDISEVNNEEKAVKLIKLLNDIEFHWWKSNAIKSLEYVYGEPIIPKIESLEQHLISKILKNLRVYNVKCKSSLDFYKKVDEIIKGH
jgi:hypothetical protein